MSMIGVYLSGTGNSKRCLEKLIHGLEPGAECIPMESTDVVTKIAEHETVFLAYPTQFSNAPYMVREFIKQNRELWKGRKMFFLTTMGLFSGDGTGCCARIVKKFGADVLGGLQVRMPDSVADCKALKKTREENQKIIDEADRKVTQAAETIRTTGRYPQEGIGFPAHLAGLFGQRLWFFYRTNKYCKTVKISDACVGCGLCAKHCPTGNLSIADGKAVAGERCTMCYRCVNNCPKQAVTILGRKVASQHNAETYEG